MSIRIKYVLGSLLVIFLFLVWSFISSSSMYNSKQCFKTYSLEEEFRYLNKTHDWKISLKPFIKIESYIGDLKDGISIDYEIDSEYNDRYIFIRKYKLNKRTGASFSYINNKLFSIEIYSNNMKNGIALQWDNNSPSLLVVYINDKAVGLTSFWEDGRTRGIKFGSKYFNKSGTKHNDTYDNGQKAFEYIEENNIRYWAVYNPQGEFLVKYPTDNDYCKAQFFENGKEVKIPYYFDQKEFEEIYEKIKNDIH